MVAAQALLLSACAKAQLKPLQPAVLVNASASNQQTLTQAMQKLANKSVSLPSHAFIDTPQLVLVDNIKPSAGNPQGLGMEHLPPHRFELQSDGQHCWLVYLNTQASLKLTDLSCTIAH